MDGGTNRICPDRSFGAWSNTVTSTHRAVVCAALYACCTVRLLYCVLAVLRALSVPVHPYTQAAAQQVLQAVNNKVDKRDPRLNA